MAEMHQVGRHLLDTLAPGAEQKLGYHVPPWTSVNHLHLHAFVLPHEPPWKVARWENGLGRASVTCPVQDCP